MRRLGPRSYGLFILLVLLSGCAAPPGPHFVQQAFSTLPGWETDDLHDAGTALAHGCARLAARASWQAACQDFPTDPQQWRLFIEARFQPWQVRDGDRDTGFFTGYYEATVRVSHAQHDRYQYPIYGQPTDLATAELGAFKSELKGQTITGRVEDGRFIPYYTRAQITSRLLPTAPVLLWADDPVDLFFVQVQGSGRAILDDGSFIRLAYAGQNGQPYVAIGHTLKAQGQLPADHVTMPMIRTWLQTHPAERDAILNSNPSYVFFKPGGAAGPIGAAGTVLTPERSLAIDHHHLPLGSFLWLDCDHPDGSGRWQHLVVAEDTGGAIKGLIRGDVFWGYGDRAAQRAGNMQSQGQLFILWPRGETPHAE